MTPENGEARERIAKVIARSGVCSRRDAERLIADGRVTLNGRAVTTPAIVVVAEDEIKVDGRPLPAPEARRLWRYHKPKGLLTTSKDPAGRAAGGRRLFDALIRPEPRTSTPSVRWSASQPSPPSSRPGSGP